MYQKYFLFNCIFFLLFSCSTKKERRAEEISEAIDTAKIYLTKGLCNDALEVLTLQSNVGVNVDYIKTLASSYACLAEFKSTVFYGTNLSKVNSAQALFLDSLTTFSTSEMASPLDFKYVNLQKAIDTLLYAGNVLTPSATERAKIFTSDEAGDINIFALYMVLSQLGKYLYYYGNVNPITGEKGAGNSGNGNTNNLSNGCLYDYNPSDSTGALALAITAARTAESLGSCTLTATGHPKLASLPNATTVTRMCQGVVLFNQMLDLLGSISLPGDTSSLSDVTSNFQALCTAASGTGDVCTVLDLAECETNFSTTAESDKLQAYFFAIYEQNL